MTEARATVVGLILLGGAYVLAFWVAVGMTINLAVGRALRAAWQLVRTA